MATETVAMGVPITRGLPVEILRQIFTYLPVETLRSLCLSCSLFQQVAAEFAFSRCTISFHVEEGLDIARMKTILTSSTALISCVRDFAVVLDMTSTSELFQLSYPDLAEPPRSLAQWPGQEEMLVRLLERLKWSQMRSISISRNLLLAPETVFTISRLYPDITKLSIRPGRLVRLFDNPRQLQLDDPFTKLVATWSNLQHLSLDLRDDRIGYNVPGALHIAMELISRNCATLQSLAVEIQTTIDPEETDGLRRVLEIVSGAPGEPDWRPFVSQQHTTFPTQLPLLTKLQLSGWPNLGILDRTFAQGRWQPNLLKILRLDGCARADECLINIAGELTGLRSLAVINSCRSETLERFLWRVPHLTSIFLRYPVLSTGDDLDYPETIGRHSATLRYLWLEPIGLESELGMRVPPHQMGWEWMAAAIRRCRFLEELAIPTFTGWPAAVDYLSGNRPFNLRHLRIIRRLLPPNTSIEESVQEAAAGAVYLNPRNLSPFDEKLLPPKLQLIVFGAWKMHQNLENARETTPNFQRISYKNGEDGKLVPVPEKISMADAKGLFPRSPILSFDSGEREWADYVDVEPIRYGKVLA
ncbi:hypothetical protein ABW21_db0204509 [Orbilia brochopaga]|nr:hypothetical protein ABW21_db0204509 [Drechslerella brochopaga]